PIERLTLVPRLDGEGIVVEILFVVPLFAHQAMVEQGVAGLDEPFVGRTKGKRVLCSPQPSGGVSHSSAESCPSSQPPCRSIFGLRPFCPTADGPWQGRTNRSCRRTA